MLRAKTEILSAEAAMGIKAMVATRANPSLLPKPWIDSVNPPANLPNADCLLPTAAVVSNPPSLGFLDLKIQPSNRCTSKATLGKAVGVISPAVRNNSDRILFYPGNWSGQTIPRALICLRDLQKTCLQAIT